MYAIRSYYAEVPIKNSLRLDKYFNELTYDEERMGGQVGIIANLLSILNLKKVIAYSPILSKKQSEMFKNSENLVFPTLIGGKLELKKPIDSYRDDDLKIRNNFV